MFNRPLQLAASLLLLGAVNSAGDASASPVDATVISVTAATDAATATDVGAAVFADAAGVAEALSINFEICRTCYREAIWTEIDFGCIGSLLLLVL